jgi:hypothetical protein
VAAAPRSILVDPRGGPVLALGRITEPGFAPLKIDVWRYVRHPPPDMIHAFTVKALVEDLDSYVEVGPAATLIGKAIRFTWTCDHLPRPAPGTVGRWQVSVDIRQDGRSVAGYPAVYEGPIPPGQPLAQLKVTELVEDVRFAGRAPVAMER